ncbi:hypothetical protein BCR44DRAFT_1427861 [Catenaria anguillulae PL171]|uniref:non-specific serine/threonine protein kinase n=1 Tax=Catenaria anguillulae PL171 TaxID=765915 RepID=A0A1Y2HW54_9FUNG|nr:hypothetical protein BCR44DRAFT_1427861 [Catenaria anguillulae PL171]
MQSRQVQELERLESERRAQWEREEREREEQAKAQSMQLDAHLQREQARRERVMDEHRKKKKLELEQQPGLAWYQLEGTVAIGAKFALGRAVAVSPDDPDSQVFEALLVTRRLADPSIPTAAAATLSGSTGNSNSNAQFSCTRLMCVDTRTEQPVLAHLARTTHAIASAVIQSLRPLSLTCSSATYHPHICVLYDFLIHHDGSTPTSSPDPSTTLSSASTSTSWSILALEEPISSGSLDLLLSQCKRLDLATACLYTGQLLDALAHLHETTAHGCLDLDHVLVTPRGAIKLSCATAVMARRPARWPEQWAVDRDDDDGASGGPPPRKADTYHVALAFVAMVAGVRALDWFAPAGVLDMWRSPAPGPAGSSQTGSPAGSSRGTSERGLAAVAGGGVRESALQVREARDLLSRLPKSLKDALVGLLTHTPRPTAELATYFCAVSRRIQAVHSNLTALDTMLIAGGSSGSAGGLLGGPPGTPVGGISSPFGSLGAGGAVGPGPEGVGSVGGISVVQSRYQMDFEEVEYIGRGGFGQVVKARNRLDGRLYAIKTVHLSRNSNDNRKLLREVRTLSRLNSSRCVRYYQAWVEDSQGTWVEDSETDDVTATSASDDDTDNDANSPHSKSPTTSRKRRRSKGAKEKPVTAGKKTDDDSLTGPQFAFDECVTTSTDEDEAETDEDWMSFDRSRSFAGSSSRLVSRFFAAPSDSEPESDAESASESESETASSAVASSVDTGDNAPRSSKQAKKRGGGKPELDRGAMRALASDGSRNNQGGIGSSAGESATGTKTLYIQMEYCENRTLSDIIDQGITLNEAWRLLRQIVEGLAHIHATGIIHRDLKPKNIFMDGENNVKIGDFGLATTNFYTSTHYIDPTTASSTAQGTASAPIPIGTAKSTTTGATPSAFAATSNSLARADISLTNDIGTALYTAPEVRSASVKYNQKVDQYSVGIIFFEMLYPFSTGMERFTILRDLRLPEIKFPNNFSGGLDSPQAKLIRWLLNHDPAQRPTSLELLHSHLLPTTMEDEYIQEAMRVLTNPANTTQYTKLLHTMFAQPTLPFLDFTYDDPAPVDIKYAHSLSAVHDIVTRVFRMHGATELAPPLLAPKSDVYHGKRVAQFLDTAGNLVMLPYNLTVPYAQYLARVAGQLAAATRDNNTGLRRYVWGSVYRENPIGGQPRAALEADLDIVVPVPAETVANLMASVRQCIGVVGGAGPLTSVAGGKPHQLSSPARKSTGGLLPSPPVWVQHLRPVLPIDAEVILATTQVLDAMAPVHRQGYHLVLNHTLLVDAIFSYARVPEHQHAVLMSTLDQMYKSNASQIRTKLLSILSKRCVDELMPFISTYDHGQARTVLASLIAHPSLGGAVHVLLSQIDQLAAWLRTFGISCTILISPLLTYNYVYYRGGVVFQARLNAQQHRADVVASGGRYDHLVGQYLPPGASPPVGLGRSAGVTSGTMDPVPAAMGVHFAVQKLAWVHQQHYGGSVATQVLVGSFGSGYGLLAERMKVAKELWAAGIPCEMLYEERSNTDLLVQQCKSQGIQIIVFVKADASGSVKVRNVRNKHEVETLRTALVDHVLVELATVDPAEAVPGNYHVSVAHPMPTSSTSTANAPHGLGPAFAHLAPALNMSSAASGQVVLVTPAAVLRKLKQKQKQHAIEKAAGSVARAVPELVGAPVVAVYSLGLGVLRAVAAEYACALVGEGNGRSKAKSATGSQGIRATELASSNADRELVAQVQAALDKLKAQDSHCMVALW